MTKQFGNFYAVVLASATVLFAANSTARAQSWSLNADPNYSYTGSSQPTAITMTNAIQARLGVPISIVSTLYNQNTSYPPIQADTGVAPYYVYGPSANGVIKNLNLNTSIVTGIVSGKLREAGTVAGCGVNWEKFVVRLFTATQFYDVLVRFNGCSGGFAAWDFYRVSGPRAITASPSSAFLDLPDSDP